MNPAEPSTHHPDLDKLFRESAGDLARYFFRRHGSDEVARDLVQEVFLQLARKECQLQGSARGYLFGIARHLSAAFWRRQYRQPETISMEEALEAESAGRIPDERLQQAREILATLPDRDREILDLRFAHGLSYAETAETLGIPVGTVRSRLHHAIGELRRRFASDSPP
jgi:RNA polymerase sigma-70 factor (ECF subfamily)